MKHTTTTDPIAVPLNESALKELAQQFDKLVKVGALPGFDDVFIAPKNIEQSTKGTNR